MPDAAEPILLKNVWKLYGKTTALAGLSLAVPPGTIFGFLGPNGSGNRPRSAFFSDCSNHRAGRSRYSAVNFARTASISYGMLDRWWNPRRRICT